MVSLKKDGKINVWYRLTRINSGCFDEYLNMLVESQMFGHWMIYFGVHLIDLPSTSIAQVIPEPVTFKKEDASCHFCGHTIHDTHVMHCHKNKEGELCERHSNACCTLWTSRSLFKKTIQMSIVRVSAYGESCCGFGRVKRIVFYTYSLRLYRYVIHVSVSNKLFLFVKT